MNKRLAYEMLRFVQNVIATRIIKKKVFVRKS